jgi:acetyl-CoA carboxylase carboxyl transferase subunit beta
MAWFKGKSKRKIGPQADDSLWVVCPACKTHVHRDEWYAGPKVCPKCDFHERLSARERLTITLDSGSFREFNADITISDPLHFADTQGTYVAKAEAAKAKTGMNEAVVTGAGKIDDQPVVVAVMDFRFLGGSLGSGTGEKILLGAEFALRHRRPYIVFCASGGARMHEGIVSLMQMAKTCAGVARLNRAGIPYISVLTDPTTGGVSASFAMVGDIHIAEPKALIGFAGRRVIEKTIRQKLPAGFQTAEYLLEHGFIDMIVKRRDMRKTLSRILQYWRR